MFKSYYMESDRSVKKRLWNQESGADTVCQFAGGVEVVRSILIPNPPPIFNNQNLEKGKSCPAGNALR
jgi:hypothetical protein